MSQDKKIAKQTAYDLELLRQCFALPRVNEPVLDEFVPDQLRPAAVLLPIVNRAEAGLNVLLTRRADHLHHHPGQISFPGGRREAEDGSPTITALRETEEEIGLPRSRVEVLGELPEYHTGTGFCITPIVGVITPPFDLAPDSFEVAEVFEVPLEFLLNPVNHQRHSMTREGRVRNYYAMPYGSYYIWGATAGIILSLWRFLNESPQ
ncbi:CoA pyrophosphatase [Azoarcus sp. TTM-91]|uniref:CoA pyrophosphatase n=1 Tax=Azoarcus sp. TTM-91 TaxID=2691581 RepID=UPI00145EE555|nr:CoA pyrophosphatase [Azoarcus sp. TTM-91]NMG34809.1 CoA pyrophosphatase [Azoarcus sp. TTM-91]